MFIEKQARAQGERIAVEGEVSNLKLSEAIRLGSLQVYETRAWDGCAIGTALQAVGQYESIELFGLGYMMKAVHVFNVPFEVVEKVSWMHYQGKMNRLQLADWLEERGY